MSATVRVGSSPIAVAYDSGNGDAYVANSNSGTVSVISGTTVEATVGVGGDPHALAYDPGNGYVYVANFNSDTVSIVSGASVVGTVNVGSGPDFVVYDNGTQDIFVSNWNSGNVSVISGMSLVATITVGTGPIAMAYDSGLGFIYVANYYSNSVTVIHQNVAFWTQAVGTEPDGIGYDGQNGYIYVANGGSSDVSEIGGPGGTSLEATVSVGNTPNGVAYDSADGDVYVANANTNNVSVIAGSAVTASVNVGSYPLVVSYDAEDGYVYAANSDSSNMSVIAGTRLVGTIGVENGPGAIAFDSGNADVYVIDANSNSVSVISTVLDLGTLGGKHLSNGPPAIASTINVQLDAWGVAYDPANGYSYVTDAGTNNVSVISGSTVIATVGVGVEPFGVAYDWDNGYVYVANTGSNNVSVISGTSVEATTVGLNAPRGVAFDPQNGFIYVTNSGGNSLAVIQGLTVITSVIVGSGPYDAAYDSSNGYVYVTNAYGWVSVVSGLTDIDTIHGVVQPLGIAFDSGNGEIYVADFGSNQVDVVLGTSIVGTVNVGTRPASVSYDSGNGNIYASNTGSSNVSVIAGSSLVATFPAPSVYNAAFDSVNGLLYLANYNGKVDLIPTVIEGAEASSLQLDVGQEINLSAPLVYHNPGVGGVNVSVSPSSGLACTPISNTSYNVSVACAGLDPGIYTVNVTLTVPSGNTAWTTTSVTVFSDPSISVVMPSRGSADVGQTIVFSAVASGGTGDYQTYTWNAPAGMGCSASTSNTLTCVPAVPINGGLVAVNVTDTDLYASANLSLAYTVDADPTISAITATNDTIDVGQQTGLSVVGVTHGGPAPTHGGDGATVPSSVDPPGPPVGGTYYWKGLPGGTGCASADSPSIPHCAPALAGTYSVEAFFNDSNGFNVSSPTFSLVVSPALAAPTATASRLTLDVGQTTILSASVSGGTGIYTYEWTELPPGCNSGNSAVLYCSPTAVGSGLYGLSVTVFDSNGETNTSKVVNLTVYPDPALSSLSPYFLGLPVTGSITGTPLNITGNTAFHEAFDPDNGYIYVAGYDGIVNVIKGYDDVFITNITIGVPLSGITYDGANGMLYVVAHVGNGFTPDALAVISGFTNTAVGSIPIGASSYGVSYDPADGLVYVSDFVNPNYVLTAVNVTTESIVANIPLGPSGMGVAYDNGNGDLYVATGTTEVAVVDPYSEAVVGTVFVGAQPTELAYDGSDSEVYVADSGSSSVSVISGTSLVATVTVGLQPDGIAFDSGNEYVYVSNSGDNTVSVISSSSNAVVGLIDVGPSPMGIAYDQWNGNLYVANTGNGTVSVISTVYSAISPPYTSMDVGQSIFFESLIASQGAGFDVLTVSTPQSYGGLTCVADPVGDLVATFACLANTAGVYTVILNMEDQTGAIASLSFTLTVYWDPTVYGPDYSSSTVDVNQSLTISVSPYGGTGSYSYFWFNLPDGCPNLDAPTITCEPSSAAVGDWQVIAFVSDSNDYYEYIYGGELAIFQDPTISTPQASITSLDVGQLTDLSVFAYTGTGLPGTVSWSGLPYGCQSSNSTLLTCYPDESGTFIVTASIQDSDGYNITSASLIIVVSNELGSASLSSTHNEIDVGQEIRFYSSETGGTGIYSYSWSAVGLTGCGQGLSAILSCIPDAPGIGILVTVTVTDSNGESSTSNEVQLGVVEDPTITTPSATNRTIDVGESTTFSAISTNGTGLPSLYAWSGLPSGCAGLDSLEILCAPDSAGVGTYTVSVSATDSDNYTVSSGWETIVVSPELLTPTTFDSRYSLDVGQTVIFYASVFGGTGSFTYLWENLPAGCISADVTALSCTPGMLAMGNFKVYVNVTDSNGELQASNPLAVSVSADPTISVPAATNLTLDIGGLTDLVTTATNGTGLVSNYSWLGLPAGCISYDLLEITCSPTATGAYSVRVTITDSNNFTVTSGGVILVISPHLNVPAVSSTRRTLDVGQSVTLTASASGGTGSYEYVWLNLPSGCDSSNTADLLCLPNATGLGTYVVSVVVYDSNKATQTSLAITLKVVADPTVTSPTATRSSLDVGQMTGLSTVGANYTGSPSTFQWSGLPAGCPSANASTITCTPTASGTYTVGVTFTDSNGFAVASGDIVLVVSPVLASPSITPAASAIDLGQHVVFSTAVSGGSGGYTYVWVNLPAGCTSYDTGLLTCTPIAPGVGSYFVVVTVSDSNGASVTSAAVHLTVSADPTIGLPTASMTSLDVGQTTHLASVATNGTGGSSTYVWSGLPAGCTSTSSLAISCAPSAGGAGTHLVTISITDSNGVTVVSKPLTIVVCPALGAISVSVSRSSLDVGQLLTLSTSETGGTGIYTFTWTGLPVGCTAVSAAAVTCAPSLSGTYSVSVSITDTNGATVGSLGANLTISPALETPIVGSSAQTVDVGQTLTFTATLSGGSGGLTYTWIGLPTGCVATGATADCIPSTSGHGEVSVTVNDSNGAAVSSSELAYSVVPHPTLSSPLDSRSSADVGQQIIFAVTASGGSGSLSYLWEGLPTGCVSSDTDYLTCTPLVAGSFNVSVTVMDSEGLSNTSGTLEVTISHAFFAGTLSAEPGAIDLGQSTSIIVSTAGGLGPVKYTWAGLPAGCTGSDTSAQVLCKPTATGEFWVSVIATDDNGASVDVGPFELVVSPQLGIPVVTESVATVVLGGTVIFSAGVTGGTSPLAYVWSGLPTGCISADTSAITCVPTAKGSYTVTVAVTDGAHETQNGSATTVVVTPVPAAPSPGFLGGANGLEYTESGLSAAALVVAFGAIFLLGRKLGKSPGHDNETSGEKEEEEDEEKDEDEDITPAKAPEPKAEYDEDEE